MEKIYQKAKLLMIISIMIAIPLIKFCLITAETFGIDIASTSSIYFLWIISSILLLLYIYDIKYFKKKINYIDILVFIIALLGLLSTIFSINVGKSIVGQYGRDDGLLTLIGYCLLFLLTKNIDNKKDKELIIKIFLAVGIINVIYEILQVFTPLSFIRRHSQFKYIAPGLCSNPNFCGSLMSMLVIYSVCKYITSNNYKYLILSIIYNIGLTLAQSSGPFVSVIIVLIIMLFNFKEKKRLINTIIILLITFIITNITYLFVQEHLFHVIIETQYNIYREIIFTFKQILGIIDETEKITNLGNGRIKIWITLLPFTKYYWLIGSGLDTIVDVLEGTDLSQVDKAHNIYLQTLITNGIPALLVLCTFYFNSVKKAFKSLDINTKILGFTVLIYLIQGFVNINTHTVEPFFIIVLGLLYSELKDTKLITKK